MRPCAGRRRRYSAGPRSSRVRVCLELADAGPVGRSQGWRNDSKGGGGLGLGDPRGKGPPECLKEPKTTYATMAIGKKQFKRNKKGPFSLYLGSPRSHPRNEINGVRGQGPSRSPPPPVSPAMVGAPIRNNQLKSPVIRKKVISRNADDQYLKLAYIFQFYSLMNISENKNKMTQTASGKYNISPRMLSRIFDLLFDSVENSRKHLGLEDLLAAGDLVKYSIISHSDP